jgi:hypothetical protein
MGKIVWKGYETRSCVFADVNLHLKEKMLVRSHGNRLTSFSSLNMGPDTNIGDWRQKFEKCHFFFQNALAMYKRCHRVHQTSRMPKLSQKFDLDTFRAKFSIFFIFGIFVFFHDFGAMGKIVWKGYETRSCVFADVTAYSWRKNC